MCPTYGSGQLGRFHRRGKNRNVIMAINEKGWANSTNETSLNLRDGAFLRWCTPISLFVEKHAAVKTEKSN